MNNFRNVFSALSICMMSSAVLASECIELDVEFLRYSNEGDFIEKGQPNEIKFRYGDFFKIQIVGNYPGEFQVKATDENDKTSTLGNSYFVFGDAPIVLPCSQGDACADGEFYEFYDHRLDGNETNQEVMVIYYLPCKVSGEDMNQNLASVYEQLPNCDPEKPSVGDRDYAMLKYEAVRLTSSKTKVCGREGDSEGRLKLWKKLEFEVAK
ncbi:hypothetical protein [Donghicola eburneus]|uniref:Putative secreted protein n=1 Tax=Donghicola eburneus TaxID=393278 RepID=A0A1M4MVL6_9RHOB|nr:hypothetical protein [Donghicola eburneus]SCM66450.1 putative secreted protein [Donghicola eburneus]